MNGDHTGTSSATSDKVKHKSTLGIHPRYICKKYINICPQKTSIRLFIVTLLILDKKLGSSFYKECIKFVVFYIF